MTVKDIKRLLTWTYIFFSRSEDKISKLTKEEILDKVNNWGFSELFLTGKTSSLYFIVKNYF